MTQDNIILTHYFVLFSGVAVLLFSIFSLCTYASICLYTFALLSTTSISQYTNQFAFYWLFTGEPSFVRIASHKSCISSRTSKIILYILVCVSLLMATAAFLLAFLKCMFNISTASSSDVLIHASCHYQTMLRDNSFMGNKKSFKNTAIMK